MRKLRNRNLQVSAAVRMFMSEKGGDPAYRNLLPTNLIIRECALLFERRNPIWHGNYDCWIENSCLHTFLENPGLLELQRLDSTSFWRSLELAKWDEILSRSIFIQASFYAHLSYIYVPCNSAFSDWMQYRTRHLTILEPWSTSFN